MTQTVTGQPTMADLLKKVDPTNGVVVGEKISGTILHVSKNEVLLDIPNVGLGVVRGRELYNDNFVSGLKVGESVEAVVKNLENERNMIELSFRAVGRDKIWSEIVTAYESKITVDAKIRDTNRGGFLVQVSGVYGFLPASLLAPAHSIKQGDSSKMADQLKKFLGQTFKVKIVSIDAENDTCIVSEKAAADEIAAAKLVNYSIGQQVEAEVVGLVDFGAFVRFDGDLEGLVHISEISWKKINKPDDVLHVGQKVQAAIIDIDEDNRINLSIKQTQENPWNEFVKTASVGDIFSATISKITTFGVVATSAADITGICHISQLLEEETLTPATIHEHFKVGDKKDFTILAIEKDKLYLTLVSDLKDAKKRLEAQKKKEKEQRNEAELAKISEQIQEEKSKKSE